MVKPTNTMRLCLWLVARLGIDHCCLSIFVMTGADNRYFIPQLCAGNARWGASKLPYYYALLKFRKLVHSDWPDREKNGDVKILRIINNNKQFFFKPRIPCRIIYTQPITVTHHHRKMTTMVKEVANEFCCVL